MSVLLSPIKLAGLTLRNRIGLSPMCQYACKADGLATDWHLVHLGARAAGGAGLVVAEATAVSPGARISPGDLGLWSRAHADALVPVTRFIRAQGAAAGIQLAHAGRKGSTQIPWVGRDAVSVADGGWQILAPSAIPFAAKSVTPHAMTGADFDATIADFAGSAGLAHEAGFDYVELHMGHGYLGHQFLSPLSNQRTDGWGGDFEGRTRFVREVAKAVRVAWPAGKPLAVRLSCTDWQPGGWDIDEAARLATLLRTDGVDLVVCSSGAIVPGSVPAAIRGVHAPFSERVRRESGIATGLVGGITEASHAEQLLQDGHADLVFIARAFLDDPNWALHGARNLGEQAPWPDAYARAVRAFAPGV